MLAEPLHAMPWCGVVWRADAAGPTPPLTCVTDADGTARQGEQQDDEEEVEEVEEQIFSPHYHLHGACVYPRLYLAPACLPAPAGLASLPRDVRTCCLCNLACLLGWPVELCRAGITNTNGCADNRLPRLPFRRR